MEKYRKIYIQVQRRAALRITRAYRTAPTEAILVLADTPPIDLLVQERTEVYDKGAEHKVAARLRLLKKWNDRW